MNKTQEQLAHKEEIRLKAELFKAMGNPIRLCILQKLLERGSCTVSYFTSSMDASQSTISQHLGKLKAQNIVDVRKEGTSGHYYIRDAFVEKMLKLAFE
ncbi:MAG: winged helix-turn-helix transcriptional regulator [Eubacteriaceae bacterium]|nr:winged helix-turn-helix transcriptional regulator [Eubacteriaceae bacterium]